MVNIVIFTRRRSVHSSPSKHHSSIGGNDAHYSPSVPRQELNYYKLLEDLNKSNRKLMDINKKPIDTLGNTGKIGFEGITSHVNNHNTRIDKFDNNYGYFSKPRYIYYRRRQPYTSRSNSQNNYGSQGDVNNNLFDHCSYYGGFNNNPLDNLNTHSHFNENYNDRCKNNGFMKNKINGPGFGMGLLGGAATGIPVGMLLGMGLNSFNSTIYQNNNEA